MGAEQWLAKRAPARGHWDSGCSRRWVRRRCSGPSDSVTCRPGTRPCWGSGTRSWSRASSLSDRCTALQFNRTQPSHRGVTDGGTVGAVAPRRSMRAAQKQPRRKYFMTKKVKIAHTRLPSVGFRSWSRFLAVSLQVTWVINLVADYHCFPPGLQLPPQPLRGLLPILLLGEQRHNGCEQFA